MVEDQLGGLFLHGVSFLKKKKDVFNSPRQCYYFYFFLLFIFGLLEKFMLEFKLYFTF